MKCPRCNTSVLPLQNTCSACGFSAALLHGCLGNQWVRLERITDAAHCLRLEDARSTEVVLDDFERVFPQAFFAAYLGVLPSGLTVAELGFWLLNQGAFNTHSVNRRNDFGIVLVVDPSAQTASLTLGYAIEKCFSAGAINHIMKTTGSHLTRAAFGAAIKNACVRCHKQLRKHAHSMVWQPDANMPPNMALQPLRGGHKSTSRSLAGHSHTRS
jgi:hypothetical protein